MIRRRKQVDRRLMRSQNKVHHIIDLFRQHGELSKVEAKKRSGYAMSTVLAAFDTLRRQKMIVSTGVEEARETRGPKPTFYRLNPQRKVYLGITFTQSGIYSALVSFSGQVIRTHSEELDIRGGEKEFLSRFRSHLAMLRKEHAEGMSALQWVGVSLPGDIDKAQGVLLSYTFMPYLKRLDFRTIVSEFFPGIALQFEQNITGFLSYLLMDHSMIREHPLILFISLRSGLANGLIHEGRIVTPTGEIGHTTVSDEPRRCVCGRSGCLELYLSHRSLSDALMGVAAGGQYLTIQQIVSLYRSGDAAAVALVNERFGYLAKAIVNSANLLSPDLIVLSGELFECFADPAAALREMAGRGEPEGGYIRRFSQARLMYRAMGTEASAIGLCYSRIKSDFAYVVEAPE